jgi:hypothetical protein
MRIRRGFLSPYLKCANCGQISRQKINISSAIWIWPLAIFSWYWLTDILKKSLYCEYQLLYLIIIPLFVPLFIAIKRGCKLVPIQEKQVQKSRANKWIFPIIVILISAFLLGYYTRDWLNILLGLSIGLIVWACYYYFSTKGK